MHRRLVIIGASGHGRVVADIAEQLHRYEKIVFLDDNATVEDCMGYSVVGKSNCAWKYIGEADFFVGIGDAKAREKMMNRLNEIQADITTLIHPSAVVSKHVTIGKGTAVMAGAVINPGSVIGNGCVVNTCASVDHDCTLDDYVHVAVGAHLCGTVSVDKSVWIGAGVVVKNNISICSNCMIGAGAIVVKDVQEPGTYIGVPARKVACVCD